jgi:hypothetical protein
LATGDPAAGAAGAASVCVTVFKFSNEISRVYFPSFSRYCKMLERRFDLLADPSHSMGGVDAQMKAWDAMVKQELENGANLSLAPQSPKKN